MAICTQCGAVMQDADAINHTCDAANLPQKGTEIVAGAVIAQQIKKAATL